MNTLRGALRFSAMMLFAVYIYLLALFCLLWLPVKKKEGILNFHARMMMAILGIGARIEGKVEPGTALGIANHVSFVDIVLLYIAHPGRFVAKKEIASWPVIGTITKGTDTLFIDRKNNRSILGVNAAIAASLKAKEDVYVFAEGRTGDGTKLLPFKSNLFQPAVDTGSDIQPVALCYEYGGKLTDKASYCSKNLLKCLWDIVTTPGITATIKVLAPIKTAGKNRHQLAREASAAMAAAMGVDDPLSLKVLPETPHEASLEALGKTEAGAPEKV